jgi:hypothetical protein
MHLKASEKTPDLEGMKPYQPIVKEERKGRG